jgi:hypothetical protein
VVQDDTLDPATGSSDDPVDVLRACARQVSIASAQLLAAIVAVADSAKPGFDADEVAFALAWTQTYACCQVALGRYLTRTLPAVFTALAAGELDLRRAWVFADALTVVDDPVASTVAARVLPDAPGLTTSQLRDRLRRAVLKTDPDAKRRITSTIEGATSPAPPTARAAPASPASGCPRPGPSPRSNASTPTPAMTGRSTSYAPTPSSTYSTAPASTPRRYTAPASSSSPSSGPPPPAPPTTGHPGRIRTDRRRQRP